jgi:aspartyl-tRNA(Asn)/glutamyl-tRNA(Gln) amidotransferase subunit A
MKTLQELAAALDAGTTSASELVDHCLARIADPHGEGRRAFLRVNDDAARAAAAAIDALRRAGLAPSPYAGIPISVKDLFDLAGEPTPAGSIVLADAPPAAETAPSVARLIAAGLIPLGRTNMTEFAFSGLGLNPHYDTPRSPWDRATGRMPGGSTSGGAVSVSDGMAYAAIGTDTGGSCRIPAAMCGIVGYKPTQRRIPVAGAFPLSSSLDSVGPLANSAACCAILDALMAGETPAIPAPLNLNGLRVALPANLVLDGMENEVAQAYANALAALEAAGARLIEVAFPALDEIGPIQAKGGLNVPEAWATHRDLLSRDAERYDQRVRQRIERGANVPVADYIDALRARAAIIARMDAQTRDFDVLAMPTCPKVPPSIAELADDAAYTSTNLLMLRNTAMANFLDRCAISIPCHRSGEAPVGLMLMGETMGDARLFRIAQAVEAALADWRS